MENEQLHTRASTNSDPRHRHGGWDADYSDALQNNVQLHFTLQDKTVYFLKVEVSSLRLKEDRSAERSFHARGPATAKFPSVKRSAT